MVCMVRAHELKVARVCVHDQAGTCWISSSSTDRRLCSTSLDPASFLRVRAEFKFNTRMIRTCHLIYKSQQDVLLEREDGAHERRAYSLV